MSKQGLGTSGDLEHRTRRGMDHPGQDLQRLSSSSQDRKLAPLVSHAGGDSFKDLYWWLSDRDFRTSPLPPKTPHQHPRRGVGGSNNTGGDLENPPLMILLSPFLLPAPVFPASRRSSSSLHPCEPHSTKISLLLLCFPLQDARLQPCFPLKPHSTK